MGLETFAKQSLVLKRLSIAPSRSCQCADLKGMDET